MKEGKIMKDLKVVFMGTPDFCVPILEELNDKYLDTLANKIVDGVCVHLDNK